MRPSTRLLAVVSIGALILTACGRPEVTVQNVPGADSEGTARGITVSGIGEVKGTPDTLTLTFGVSVLRDDVSTAVGDAADLADALIVTLKGHGIAEEDVQTANYSIYPEYDWSENRQRLRGYRVDNSVTARIRDIDRAGEIIDAAAASAGDEVRISGVRFSLEDNKDLLEAARASAWADAKGKADQLAGLAGVTLGSPVSITESVSSAPPPVIFARAEAAADSAVTPIEAGQETVTVSLNVTFAISS